MWGEAHATHLLAPSCGPGFKPHCPACHLFRYRIPCILGGLGWEKRQIAAPSAAHRRDPRMAARFVLWLALSLGAPALTSAAPRVLTSSADASRAEPLLPVASAEANHRRQLGTCPSALPNMFNMLCGNAKKASAGNCLLCLNGASSMEGHTRDCASAFDAFCAGTPPPPPPPPPPCDCGYYPAGEGCSRSGGGCGCMGTGYCNVGGHCTKVGSCPGGHR